MALFSSPDPKRERSLLNTSWMTDKQFVIGWISLATVVMLGWLYLIAQVVWAAANWLLQ
jgi:hypothetical protein